MRFFTADRSIEGPWHPESARQEAEQKQEEAKPKLTVNPEESKSFKIQGINTDPLKASLTETFENAFRGDTKLQTLFNTCVFLIFSFALKNTFVYLNGKLIFRVQTKTAKKLRDDVFRNIIEMHLDYFNKNRVGNLMNLVYNNVQAVNSTINSTFVNFLQNPFSILVYLGVLLMLSWKLTVLAGLTSLLILFVILTIGKRLKDLAASFRTQMGDMNSVLQEKFSGLKVIKSSAFEDVGLNMFKEFTRDFRNLDIQITRLRNIIGPLNETLLIAAIAMVLWFGGLQVFEGKMTSSELIMFALVGQSGSGKSTAVDLLLRFYDVHSGRITIDGTDIREFDYKQLRHMIGVVSQEVILFNDTIESNIAYGVREEARHEMVERAAKLANAHGFITEKPEGYQTFVGERGIQLSGGQRQPLAIARAMVKNPELLIFDEATSALDNKSEKVVQQAIDYAMENRTALVVAHRLSTIRNADRIIVMERGRVMESGNHEELMAQGALYKYLYEIQFADKKGGVRGWFMIKKL
jgi:ABC-type multidrug transport system fused ATPase/permease subunit